MQWLWIIFCIEINEQWAWIVFFLSMFLFVIQSFIHLFPLYLEREKQMSLSLSVCYLFVSWINDSFSWIIDKFKSIQDVWFTMSFWNQENNNKKTLIMRGRISSFRSWEWRKRIHSQTDSKTTTRDQWSVIMANERKKKKRNNEKTSGFSLWWWWW